MYDHYMLIQEHSAKVGRCHSNIKSKKEKKGMKKCLEEKYIDHYRYSQVTFRVRPWVSISNQS